MGGTGEEPNRTDLGPKGHQYNLNTICTAHISISNNLSQGLYVKPISLVTLIKWVVTPLPYFQ